VRSAACGKIKSVEECGKCGGENGECGKCGEKKMITYR